MADTYYKFAERSAESQVNWGEVGRSVSEMLLEDAAVREQKKTAIDEASRQFGEVLSNAPTGDFKPANEWILEYANDATQAMLLQDRLLKSGALSLKDYTVQRQNINDSTNQMFDISKKYQDKYTEAKKRAESGVAQDTEMWIKTQAEGLSNFTNTKAYINPTNYQVSISKLKRVVGSDGKEVLTMDDSPDGRMTINQLNNYLDIKLDKYYYTQAVGTQVKSLGKFLNTESIARIKNIYRTYGVTNISDPTKRPKFGKDVTDEDLKNITVFEQWEKDTIAAQMANPFNQLSVLTDALDIDPKTGEEYVPTFDAALAKTSSKYILIADDGSGMIQPKFTKEQDEVADDFMRIMVRNSIDQESETDTQALPSTEYSPYVKADANASAGGGGANTENVTIYESANNALRTGNLSALNNNDYVYSVQTSNGKRFIAVRPKTDVEKKTGRAKTDFDPKNKQWKKLINADDVAAYLTGVSNARQKYIQGKQEFKDIHDFTLFGTYLDTDSALTSDQIYDIGTYTEPERNKRLGGTGENTEGGASNSGGKPR
jgi:hypothetical protein